MPRRGHRTRGTSARISAVLALAMLGGCGAEGGTGPETPAAIAPSGAGGELSASVAANQQGRAAPDARARGLAGGAPSEADVLGRSGYGGAGGEGAASGLPLIGSDREHPVPTCGPEESYTFIARDFRCPGGGPNPFGGDAQAAAAARRGNVGPHAYRGPTTGDPIADAHIVDVYEVPCPGGAVEVFVCMYHCAPGRSLL